MTATTSRRARPGTLEHLLGGQVSGPRADHVFTAAYGVLIRLTSAHRQVREAAEDNPDLSAYVPHMHPQRPGTRCLLCALHASPGITPVERALMVTLYALVDADETWNHTASPAQVRLMMRRFAADERLLHATFGPWWFDAVGEALRIEELPPSRRTEYARSQDESEPSPPHRWLAVHTAKGIRDVTHRRNAETVIARRIARAAEGL